MKRYELLYIIPTTVTDDGVAAVVGKVTEQLQAQGCQITQEVSMEKRRLAYPIKQQRYGYYRLVEFTAEPQSIARVNELLRLSQELLRHLIVEKPVKSQATIEREQALRDRLAARRQQRDTGREKTKDTAPPTAVSAEELDQKLSEILEKSPDA